MSRKSRSKPKRRAAASAARKPRRGPARGAAPDVPAPAIAAAAPPAAPPSPSAASDDAPRGKRGYVFQKAGSLMRAIFRQNDPVEIAGKLLNHGSDATKAKIFVQCLEYLYGKPVQPVEARGGDDEQEIEYRFVSNIPRPQYPPPHRAPGSLAARSSAAARPAGTVSPPPAAAGNQGG